MVRGFDLSVVIPTYNRRAALKRTLSALLDQTYPKARYEIIVVDDGSKEGVGEVIGDLPARPRARCFHQEHRGPAAARNLGITNAEGGVILFTGDDIVATASLLEEHMKWHSRYPEDNVAVLGYVTWSPEIEVTPFMRWLEDGGTQFRYREIAEQREVPWQFFYTSNISLKRGFLLENGLFDEDFPYAAHEDVELSYRLQKRGLRIMYNRQAITYHYHHTTFDRVCSRMVRVGESAAILCAKHPELEEDFATPEITPKDRLKQLVRTILYPAARQFGMKNRIVQGFLYQRMLEEHVRGYKRALRQGCEKGPCLDGGC